jgi:glycosyltransferase involved in cell wall biosynthesis
MGKLGYIMQVSVIIPTCLRSEHELIRSIDSALWNGFSDIEIIIVNDNRELKICDFIMLINRYQGKPVKFHDNTGARGAASARNFGVSFAEGEIITFLDDDDFILAGRIAQMHTAFVQYEPEGVVMVSTGRIYQYNEYSKLEVVKRQVFGKVYLKDIYLHNDIDIGFMVRKSLFLDLGGFDQSYANLEDWDFIIRALMNGSAFKIKSLSYVVKNDALHNRVSNNDYLGLEKIAEVYKFKFGSGWYYKIKTQQKISQNKFSLIDLIVHTFKTKDMYPARLLAGYYFRKLINNHD